MMRQGILAMVLIAASSVRAQHVNLIAATYNIGGGTCGGHCAYNLNNVINDIRNLYYVDVLSIQEVNNHDPNNSCQDEFGLIVAGVSGSWPAANARYAPNNFANDFLCSWGQFPKQTGPALFSKYGFDVPPQIIVLPQAGTDKRTAIRAVINHPTGKVIVYATHLTHTTTAGRLAQATAIANHIAANNPQNLPVMVLADFNAVAGSTELQPLQNFLWSSLNTTVYNNLGQVMNNIDFIDNAYVSPWVSTTYYRMQDGVTQWHSDHQPTVVYYTK